MTHNCIIFRILATYMGDIILPQIDCNAATNIKQTNTNCENIGLSYKQKIFEDALIYCEKEYYSKFLFSKKSM